MTRKSKREIERALEDFEDVEEPLKLYELVNYELERVNEKIVRIVETGEYRKFGAGGVDDEAIRRLAREQSRNNPLDDSGDPA